MSNPLLRISDGERRAKAQAANYRVRHLAKLLGISIRTLERNIKKEGGNNPYAGLNNWRMIEARVLVLEGNSVKEVAAMLGFKDASQFSKVFKQYHGCLPMGMVKKVKEKPQLVMRRFPEPAKAGTPNLSREIPAVQDCRDRTQKSQSELIQHIGPP